MLTGNVTVDIVNPGAYDISNVTPTIINAGGKLDSYFLHFDPVGTSQTVQQVSGRIEFETEVIGIIITRSRLDASDPLLKATSTLYPTGSDASRGLEAGQYTDEITLSADKKIVDINIFYANTGIDQVRILTNPIPEPAFFQMGALAAMSGLGLLRLRRKS